MILVFDVGNTNMVLGVYQGEKLLTHWRISSDRQKTSDEFGMLIRSLFDYQGLDMRAIKAVVISSVVPPLNPVLEEMSRRYFQVQPLEVGPGVKTGIALKYENPREVGADRVVNAVAAYERYGGPVIVVDFGTATTFCAISRHGEYLGGAIAPGIGISSEALFQRAAKLPRIELVKPKSVIGRNTVASMQAGIVYGFIGQVDGIVERMKAELGPDSKVVATGGFAELIAAESRTIDVVDQLLTLEGLRFIYEKNR
ncbi:MAG: type III pantothenate kinase [Syntrophomonadaceae bacterium]|nr:type III pantothenate kinase [Syntrophomonadaceae bacterium]